MDTESDIDFKNFYAVEEKLKSHYNQENLQEDNTPTHHNSGLDGTSSESFRHRKENTSSVSAQIDEALKNFQKSSSNSKYSLKEMEDYLHSHVNDNEGDDPMTTVNLQSSEYDLISKYIENERLENFHDIEFANDSKKKETPEAPLTDVGEQNLYFNNGAAQRSSTYYQAFFVVDTNVLISNLKTLEELRTHANTQLAYQIIIPSVVLKEVDSLKKYSKDEVLSQHESQHAGRQRGKPVSIQKSSKTANDWLYNNLARKDPTIRVQKSKETLNTPNQINNDDAILDCCLYFKEKVEGTPTTVVLISNDRNLCIKCLSEEIQTISFIDKNIITTESIIEITKQQFAMNSVKTLATSVKSDALKLLNSVTEAFFPHNEKFSSLVDFIEYVSNHWDANNGGIQSLFLSDPVLMHLQYWITDLHSITTTVHSNMEAFALCQCWSQILTLLYAGFQQDQTVLQSYCARWEQNINNLPN
ncbi:hypothetical protein ACO0QE_003625 [Hanseniaspora vineae]